MMHLHSINAEQKLYVMPAGNGYTCYGFEVLDRKARAVAQWALVAPPESEPGSREHFHECAAIMEAGANHALRTGKRCEATLTPELIGLEGQRVEVVDCYGETRRFYVGKSTGWMPAHLEVHNRNSSGGPAVHGAPFQSVKVIKRRLP